MVVEQRGESDAVYEMIDNPLSMSRPPSAAADSANEAKAYEIPLPAPHCDRPSIPLPVAPIEEGEGVYEII